MSRVDRRRFLQIAGGTVAATFCSDAIARAASIPAHRAHGNIKDVEHIVILMQENRSFDHYFGSMRGVRGFNDPHPVTLPSGKSVWHQAKDEREYLPFRPPLDDLGLAFIQDLDHEWRGGHIAFNNGNYDRWIPAKTPTTMAHMTRRDMPFHYALADAFTICDNYHCSLLGPTDPNRYYMWSGWVGNDGRGGGPVVDNAEKGYRWTTYPERLEQAGISWKLYQDEGLGLNAAGKWGWVEDPYIGNYGDNSLLYFNNYRNAPPGSPLFEKARTGTKVKDKGTFFDDLRRDVTTGKLPQVSWIVAPEAYTEHPNWPAGYGAWYTSNILNALTSDPQVWAKTVLLITFDENDGFFDHVVPPHASGAGIPGKSTVSLENEIYPGGGAESYNPAGPYGLGQRVPMTVVSPWSTGGWVTSEVFDHTSIIRFIEKRFGVHEPNITPFRRAVAGDLSSAFDFSRKSTNVPAMPSVAHYKPTDSKRHPDYIPQPPARGALPRQEPGTKPSRALGYATTIASAASPGAVQLGINNRGTLGMHLQVRGPKVPVPHSLTLGAGTSMQYSVPADDISVHGPNGFYRQIAGHGVSISEKHIGDALQLTITNSTPRPLAMDVVDHHNPAARQLDIPAGGTTAVTLGSDHGWYDATLTAGRLIRKFAGRIETGRDSISDPLMAK